MYLNAPVRVMNAMMTTIPVNTLASGVFTLHLLLTAVRDKEPVTG